MARRYHVLDVFTDRALAGNPLAVVLDAEGLESSAMQAIAREFALSETVFVAPPRDPTNLAHLRIFTPARELPFAGHPTVGTAVLLGLLEAPDLVRREEVTLVLEEEIGPVTCTVRCRRGEAPHARFDVPRLSARVEGDRPSNVALADRFGLEVEAIGFAGHRPSLYSAGVPFTFVPVRSVEALGRARLLGEGAYYLYTRVSQPAGRPAVRARMLSSNLGVTEDPATGAAAAAFAGVLLEHDRLGDGEHDCIIDQGVEMGRPSRIGLAFGVRDQALSSTTIGGHAVLVAEGKLSI